MTSPGLDVWLEEARAWTEVRLVEAVEELELGPERHAEALRYALFGPGKRLRPALVRLAAEHLGAGEALAAAPAVAVEMVHTYSLVHDDLPSMDDDDLRRGRATCHRVYGEAEAVLVGDGLQALAFEWLARRGGSRAAELVAILARAAGPAGMVGGQSLDVSTEAGAGEAAVRDIHAAKTGALIAAAVEMGAVVADAAATERAALRRYGEALGLCFQAVDDVLDTTGDAPTLGKTPGKDAARGRASLVDALGVEGARRSAERHADSARAQLDAAPGALRDLLEAMVERFLSRRA